VVCGWVGVWVCVRVCVCVCGCGCGCVWVCVCGCGCGCVPLCEYLCVFVCVRVLSCLRVVYIVEGFILHTLSFNLELDRAILYSISGAHIVCVLFSALHPAYYFPIH